LRRDIDRLQDVLEAIERIEQRTALSREAFDADPLVQCGWSAVERDVPQLRRQVLAILEDDRRRS